MVQLGVWPLFDFDGAPHSTLPLSLLFRLSFSNANAGISIALIRSAIEYQCKYWKEGDDLLVEVGGQEGQQSQCKEVGGEQPLRIDPTLFGGL